MDKEKNPSCPVPTWLWPTLFLKLLARETQRKQHPSFFPEYSRVSLKSSNLSQSCLWLEPRVFKKCFKKKVAWPRELECCVSLTCGQECPS